MDVKLENKIDCDKCPQKEKCYLHRAGLEYHCSANKELMKEVITSLIGRAVETKVDFAPDAEEDTYVDKN